MKGLLIILAVVLSSCVVYEHTAHSSNGNVERDRMISFGGTASHQGADGSSYAHDHQASFQHATQAIGAYGAGLISQGMAKAKEATAQLTSNNATQVQLGAQQQAAAAGAAKLDATKAAINAGAPLNSITITPP